MLDTRKVPISGELTREFSFSEFNQHSILFAWFLIGIGGMKAQYHPVWVWNQISELKVHGELEKNFDVFYKADAPQELNR